MNTALDYNGVFQSLPINDIVLSDYNARRFEQNMSAERKRKFDELVASVREKGILQPIAVRPVQKPDGQKYEIMAGERRYRAAKEVGLAEVPAMIYDVNDAEAIDIMATENLQREDLTPVEEAQAFKDILDAAGNTVDAVKDLAKRLGITPHAVRLRVSLLSLPKPVLDAWNDGSITLGHVEQLSRIADEQGILNALAECLRRRMTIKELTEHISSRKPPMKTAKFDTAECAHCVSNGLNQGSLFGNDMDKAVCATPACFKKKQGEFFAANWMTSKAHEAFKTNGFRFGEDLTNADYIPINGDTPADRCLSCPEFVSIVTVTGGGIAPRACVSTERTCYEELYVPKKADPPAEEEQPVEPADGASNDEEAPVTEGNSTKAKTAAAKKKTSDPSEADLAKRAAQRAEDAREALYTSALPEHLASLGPNTPDAVRVYLASFAMTSTAASKILLKKADMAEPQFRKAPAEDIAKAAFALSEQDLLPAMMEMATSVLMGAGYEANTSAKARDLVASKTGFDLKSNWVLTEDYLKRLTKGDIVKMGEEEGMKLWDDPKVIAYRDQNFPKQGWMSMKKTALIDCILKSGADLSGRVPEEILNTNRAC